MYLPQVFVEDRSEESVLILLIYLYIAVQFANYGYFSLAGICFAANFTFF